MKPEDEDKTDNICNGVYWVDGGVLHSSLYWIDSLATYPKKPKEIADKKFVEQEQPKMRHVHADLMAQFAQDAQETDTPWERWEIASVTGNRWEPLKGMPNWGETIKYRRKQPKKTKMWQWLVKNELNGLILLSDIFSSEAPAESEHRSVIGKAAWTEIEV